MLEIRSEGNTTEYQVDKRAKNPAGSATKLSHCVNKSKRKYLMDRCGGVTNCVHAPVVLE